MNKRAVLHFQRPSLANNLAHVQNKIANYEARLASAAHNPFSDSHDLIVSGNKAATSVNPRGGPLLASYDFTAKSMERPGNTLLVMPFRSVDF